MKDPNHHKQEVLDKIQAKIASLKETKEKIKSGEIQASVAPDAAGQCPLNWYYDADCACCLFDVG